MEDTRYKTFWRRFGAMWIDGFMFRPLGFLTPAIEPGTSFGLVAWACVLSFIPIGYSTVMHARFGQTVGKMACGVMVLDLSETRVLSTKQAILRDALSYGFTFASFVFMAMVARMDTEGDRMAALVFGIGLVFTALVWSLGEILTTLTNSRRRSLHDFVAGTLVVKLNQLSGAEIESLKSSLPGRGQSFPQFPMPAAESNATAEPSDRGW
ncbi:MAG: RDD family protein [Dehalococcoidia bacterium]